MATTTFQPKVSHALKSETKKLREKLENERREDSAKSSFINAPQDKFKSMTGSSLDDIDTAELEYYLPEMNEEVVDIDPNDDAVAVMSERERTDAWIRSFMYAGDHTTGIEAQTSESLNIPNVQELVVNNEVFARSPWVLVEHTKEQYKLIKSLIKLKKHTLTQDISPQEAALLKADLSYLYKAEQRILREIDTAERYARQRRADIAAAQE